MKTPPQLLAELDTAPEWALFPEEYVSAARNVSLSAVRQDRTRGTGVPFVKQGRKVLYRKADIFEYLTGLRRRNVPEARPAEATPA